jgi:hypothetical protein
MTCRRVHLSTYGNIVTSFLLIWLVIVFLTLNPYGREVQSMLYFTHLHNSPCQSMCSRSCSYNKYFIKSHLQHTSSPLCFPYHITKLGQKLINKHPLFGFWQLPELQKLTMVDAASHHTVSHHQCGHVGCRFLLQIVLNLLCLLRFVFLLLRHCHCLHS